MDIPETKFHFTFQNLERQLQAALEYGYEFCTCADYVKLKESQQIPDRLIVNRVDIDFSVKKAERLGEIFQRMGVSATFFLRLHAPEYNPLSFENYRILRRLIEDGHELGYHSEIIDQAAIWGEDPSECLKRDIDLINRAFGIQIQGVASHGGMTGLNNLDFWKNHKPQEFSLLYEGYDHEPSFNLFQEAFYISDSEWIRWKCYSKGTLLQGDQRSLKEHLPDNHPLIYLLIHPDTYFNRHFYEEK